MGANSAVCGVPAQGNYIDVIGPLEAPRVDVPGLLRAAVDRAGWKHEAAGREAGYEPSYWTRVYSCERGILLDRLGRLPLDVQREFVSAWALAVGLRVERRDAGARRAAVLALAQAASALAEAL
jgi:hypothetical protein